jgi:hypothetical protein
MTAERSFRRATTWISALLLVLGLAWCISYGYSDSPSKAILVGAVLIALAVAAIPWLVFYLSRWLLRGFGESSTETTTPSPGLAANTGDAAPVTDPDSLRQESRRARTAGLLLVAGIVITACQLVSGLGELFVADGFRLFRGVLQVLGFPVLLVTGIVFLRWVHTACRVLTLTGTRQTKFTPGWAVGSWFIPFLNLARPYQILKDLWQRSSVQNLDNDPSIEPTPVVLPVWWTTYLTSGVFGLLAGAEGLKRPNGPETIGFQAIANLLYVIAGMCLIRLVAGIDRFQQGFGQRRAEAATTPSLAPESVP